MRLGWSKNDKPEGQQRDRELARNAGQLLGRLDEILPFIYIAQYGASDRDLRERTTAEAAGLFAIGAQTGEIVLWRRTPRRAGASHKPVPR